MSFEIIDRDLLARIGKLETKSGIVETPLLFPVINPGIQPISPKILEVEFGCRALITNAYIINKNFKEPAVQKGLHEFLDFSGSIMTDSGAYQLLIYKDIEVTPKEIVDFQEVIDTDIATILDIPTGWDVTKGYARYTVKETLKRAKALKKMVTRNDLLWVGPVQGGQYLDLVAKSAKEMGKAHHKKLQFDFSEEAIERLNDLRNITDASSRAEVVRNALRVYEYLNGMVKDGYSIEFRKDGTKLTVVPLPI